MFYFVIHGRLPPANRNADRDDLSGTLDGPRELFNRELIDFISSRQSLAVRPRHVDPSRLRAFGYEVVQLQMGDDGRRDAEDDKGAQENGGRKLYAIAFSCDFSGPIIGHSVPHHRYSCGKSHSPSGTWPVCAGNTSPSNQRDCIIVEKDPGAPRIALPGPLRDRYECNVHGRAFLDQRADGGIRACSRQRASAFSRIRRAR